MIATHFGWTSDPFDREIPVASLVAFQAHTEVTARLLYAAEHRQVALVTGDTGMGKTTAMRPDNKSWWSLMRGVSCSTFVPLSNS